MTEERIREIVSHCDHTQLAVTAGWEDIRALIDDAVTYGTASVCIPPCYVKQAVSYAAGKNCCVYHFASCAICAGTP